MTGWETDYYSVVTVMTGRESNYYGVRGDSDESDIIIMEPVLPTTTRHKHRNSSGTILYTSTCLVNLPYGDYVNQLTALTRIPGLVGSLARAFACNCARRLTPILDTV